MASFISFFQAHAALIFGVLFGISEALSAIPQVKANGIFQALFGLLAKLAGKQQPPSA